VLLIPVLLTNCLHGRLLISALIMPCGVMHSRSACIINMSQRERAHQAESTLGAGVIITTDGKQDRIKGQKLTVGGCKKINSISVRGKRLLKSPLKFKCQIQILMNFQNAKVALKFKVFYL
jgi:hypothetical protein